MQVSRHENTYTLTLLSHAKHSWTSPGYKSGCCHQLILNLYLCAFYKKEPKYETRLVTIWVFKNEHHLHQVEDFALYHQVIHDNIYKDCVFVNANLDNYNSLKNPRKHI